MKELYSFLFKVISVTLLPVGVLIGGWISLGDITPPLEVANLIKASFPDISDPLMFGFFGGLTSASIMLLMNPFNSVTGKYGAAHWASRRETKNMHLLAKQGLILGEAFGTYLRTEQPLSVALFAPPGTGKTAGFVIPNLFSCGNSMIINDVKGELYRITSKRRAEFSTVIRFEPASPDSARWNPLGKEVLPVLWEEKVVTIDRIAALLYQTNKEDYWVTEGKNMFLFFCMFLVWKNGGTSIPEVRSFALSSGDPQETIEEIVEDYSGDMPQRLIEEGNGMISKAEKEFASVFSTFKSKLNVFADPYVAKALSGNDLDFPSFRKTRTSLYLIIRAQDVDRLAAVVRMLFESCAMYILSNEPEPDDHTITLMIDEFARLGKLTQVLDMPALSRGNRGQACLIAQDYAQIKRIYGDGGPEIIDGTCAYMIAYPQNNKETAKNISEKIGNKTVIRTSKSKNSKDMMHGSTSESEEGIPLILPQEITSMQEWTSIILAQNHHSSPIQARAIKWWKDRNMKNLAGCVDDNFKADPDIENKLAGVIGSALDAAPTVTPPGEGLQGEAPGPLATSPFENEPGPSEILREDTSEIDNNPLTTEDLAVAPTESSEAEDLEITDITADLFLEPDEDAAPADDSEKAAS